MKIRYLLALMGLAIGFTVPTFAQQKDTVDPQITEQIRALTVRYDAAFNSQDAAALAALYTTDGAYTFHGTSHGRRAIEKSYAYDFQSRHPRGPRHYCRSSNYGRE
jgi:SnoaL-like domain